jgi:hypothetical protein
VLLDVSALGVVDVVVWSVVGVVDAGGVGRLAGTGDCEATVAVAVRDGTMTGR